MSLKYPLIIGTDLSGIDKGRGKFVVLFFRGKQKFNNFQAAIDAYNFCKGEAYLWDLGNSKKEAVLLQAKLITHYVHKASVVKAS